MATEAGTARPGSVAMETTRELGLRSSGTSPAQNPAEPLCEARAAVTAARWDLRKYSLLIVIGDIGTESQLRAVRAHLEQGEPLSWLSRNTPSVPFRHLICIHLLVHTFKAFISMCTSRDLCPVTCMSCNISLVHPSHIPHAVPQSPRAGGAPGRPWSPSGHTPFPQCLDHQTLKSPCSYLPVSSLGELSERRVHITNL